MGLDSCHRVAKPLCAADASRVRNVLQARLRPFALRAPLAQPLAT
jgi:hypothetical protein